MDPINKPFSCAETRKQRPRAVPKRPGRRLRRVAKETSVDAAVAAVISEDGWHVGIVNKDWQRSLLLVEEIFLLHSQFRKTQCIEARLIRILAQYLVCLNVTDGGFVQSPSSLYLPFTKALYGLLTCVANLATLQTLLATRVRQVTQTNQVFLVFRKDVRRTNWSKSVQKIYLGYYFCPSMTILFLSPRLAPITCGDLL